MRTETYKDGALVSSGNVPDNPEVVNSETLRSRAQAALAANAAFLAVGTPTAAQNAAQIQRLTKECNALIRLTMSALTDISDTA